MTVKARPKVHGYRVIARDERGAVLFVREDLHRAEARKLHRHLASASALRSREPFHPTARIEPYDYRGKTIEGARA